MDAFTMAYIECTLWSSTDDANVPLGSNYGVDDLTSGALTTMVEDCQQFQNANAEVLEQWYAVGETTERAGHDFWLTRNRHGAGFWDRWSNGGVEERLGRRLTDLAHNYGEANLYVNDDGQLEVS